jgi:hypothetical protein
MKRKEELARLIAEASALPAPAPPFALATRVNSNASEKGARGGLLARRFGFYPPPGTAVGAMALLGIVVLGIAVLRPAPRVEGPVDVFFTEGAKSNEKDASKPASQEAPRIKSREAPRNEIAAAAPRAQAPAAVVAAASEDLTKDAGKADVEKKPAASESAVNEPAFEAKQRQLAKAEADTDAAPAARALARAPALSAAAPQAAGAIAPGARANAGPARSWSVAVRGEGARRWMLRRAPEGRPSVASTQVSAFRVTLDADGRVTSVRALDPHPVQPALLEFVRGLVFAPVVTVTDGILRDEKAKASERADGFAERPAKQPLEIDVEVSSR